MKNIFIALLVLFYALNANSAERWNEEAFYNGSGKKYNLEQFKGKDVLLMFYATWCGYCADEMPNIANLKRFSDGKKFKIVPVSIDYESDVVIKRFLAQKNASNLPVYTDMSGNFVRHFGVREIPAFFLISKDGILSEKYSSLSDIDSEFFEQFLNDKTK